MLTIKDPSSIEEVLQYIVACYGAEIYQDKQRLSNLIADLYKSEERWKRVYRRAIIDDSLSVKIYNLSMKPLSQRKGFYNQLIFSFCELNFYPNELGEQIAESFVYGLDLPLSISQECEELLTKSMYGNAVAQNRLGHCYYDGKGIEQDYEKAVYWYQKSAEQGNNWGQYYLGKCYYDGKGIQQNYSESVKWYRKSAEQGNSYAQEALGNCYYNGKGIEQSYEDAVMWYRKSAKKGNSNATNKIGYCFFEGKGIKRNYKEAFKWFRKIANRGDANMQNFVGDYYFEGKYILHRDSREID